MVHINTLLVLAERDWKNNISLSKSILVAWVSLKKWNIWRLEKERHQKTSENSKAFCTNVLK